MKHKRTIPLLGATVIVMVLCGTAAAKTNQLEATFEGETTASLTLNVKTNTKGKPIRGSAEYSGMPILCNGEITEVSGTLPKRKISKDDGGYSLFSKFKADPVYVSMSANLNARGTKVKQGEVTTINTDIEGCAGERRVILAFKAR